MKKKNPLLTIAAAGLLASTPQLTQAATTIFSDNFEVASTPSTQFRVYENRINLGWNKAVGNAVAGNGGTVPAGTPSQWTISGGVASNASSYAATGYPESKVAEAPMFNFFSGAGTIETDLVLNFKYRVPTGDKLYVHLWGMTGTSNLDGQFVSNVEGSANGNVDATTTSTDLTRYNLTDGAASGFGGTATAISGELTGDGVAWQTFNLQFNIAGLGISGVTTAADLKYYLVQIAKDEDGTAGVLEIDDFSLTAVPEPSSLALLGLGGLGLLLRRKRS